MSVVVDAQARVFNHPSFFAGTHKPATPYLYACTFTPHRVALLADGEEVAAFPSPAIALAGYDVAYAANVQLANGGDGFEYVIVDDLRIRRALQTEYAVATGGEVGNVRVKSDGAVAWIACDVALSPGQLTRACKHPGLAEDVVVKHDSSLPAGQEVTLDEGRHIDPSSLRLRGSTLSWTDRGKRRTAKLD